MYHFKWTQCPNENTHTYKPHLIEGYRFSRSRQVFSLIFFLFFFQERKKKSTFWNQYSQLVLLQIKAAILRLMSRGTSTERGREREREGGRDRKCNSKVSSFKQKRLKCNPELTQNDCKREEREYICTKRDWICYFCSLTALGKAFKN